MPEEQLDANNTATSSEADKIIAEMENTPAGEQPVSAEASVGTEPKQEKEVPFHEHPRFKELIEKKNDLEKKVAQMQSQMASTLNKDNQVSPAEQAKQTYLKAGLKEEQAKLIADTTAELASKIADQRVKPIEVSNLQNTIDTWVAEFAKSHSDFNDLKPLMFEMFSKLPERMKDGLSSSPEGVEFLYDKARAAKHEEFIQSAFKKGVQEGYTKKREKLAGSSTGGGSSVKPTDFSEDAIKDMSLEDYKKNRASILASKSVKR